MRQLYSARPAIKVLGACFILSACATTERVRTVQIQVPVVVPCPAAVDPPAKPVKPVLPDDVHAALRVAVAHAARLSAAFDDVSGRLAACGAVTALPPK